MSKWLYTHDVVTSSFFFFFSFSMLKMANNIVSIIICFYFLMWCAVPSVEMVDDHGRVIEEKIYKTGSTIELKCVVSKVPGPTANIMWRHGLRILNYDTSRGGIRWPALNFCVFFFFCFFFFFPRPILLDFLNWTALLHGRLIFHNVSCCLLHVWIDATRAVIDEWNKWWRFCVVTQTASIQISISCRIITFAKKKQTVKQTRISFILLDVSCLVHCI